MTAQCFLCDPGACHDDACPHGVVRVSVQTFPPSYQFTLSPGIRAVVGPVAAWGERGDDGVWRWGLGPKPISNDDTRHVPFGEGKR